MRVIGDAAVHPSETLEAGRRETLFRQTVLTACLKALASSNVDAASNIGIVFSTRTGDRYTETWRTVAQNGGRIKATQFSSAILNAAAGQVCIRLHLKGPQIVVVDGDPFEVARLQLDNRRADYMVVARFEEGEVAWAFVISPEDPWAKV